MGNLLQQVEISKYANLIEILNKISNCLNEEEIFRECLNRSKWVIDFQSLNVVFYRKNSQLVKYYQVVGSDEVKSEIGTKSKLVTFIENSPEQTLVIDCENNKELFSEAGQGYGVGIPEGINYLFATKIYDGVKVSEIILFGTVSTKGFTKNDRILLRILASIMSSSTGRIRSENDLKEMHSQIATQNVILSEKNDELLSSNQLINKQQEQLVEISRLTSLGQLSSGIAHEINNPLGVVDGAMRMIERSAKNHGSSLSEEISKPTDMVKQAVVRIDHIVTNLLEFSRDSSEVAFSGVSFKSITDLINNTISTRLDRKGIELHMPSSEIDLQFYGNKNSIFHVLNCLIENSIYAIEESKNKEIEVKWIKIDGRISENTFFCTVSDSGDGVESDLKKHIMEPFFTTKPVGSGKGLGLSSAFGIIKEHSGELILCDDPEEKNTMFQFSIPIEP
jgi:signal transduction histidine kinase